MNDQLSAQPHPDWWQWPLDLDGSLTQPTAAVGGDDDLQRGDSMVAELAVLDDLGRSGQVRIRRCVQGPLGRRVLVLEAAEDGQSLVAIGRSLAAIGHPGVQRIHDGGEGLLVCADTDGESLASAWQGGRIDLRRAVMACAEVADALAQVHAGGLLHRDLKPSAIHLGRYGEVVLTGWGCAAANPQAAMVPEGAPAMSGQRLIMGSPAWMAPEQAQGAVHDMGPAIDVYGLGACLYFLLYGQPPHAGNAADALMAAAAGGLVLAPLSDPALAALRAFLATLLADKPDDRPTASAVAQGLREWLRRSERIAELGRLLQANPADLPATLQVLNDIDGLRDCWPALADLAQRRSALAEQAVDLALAGGDVDVAHALATGGGVGAAPDAAIQRVQRALAARRYRQRLQRLTVALVLVACVVMASSLGVSAWLQHSHGARLTQERSARASALRQQVLSAVDQQPQNLAGWQHLLALTWQAYALDAQASARLADEMSAQAMDWALAADQPGLASAWGLAHRAWRGGSGLNQRLQRAAQAASDREQRLAELDADLAQLQDNPLAPWRHDWYPDLLQRLGELELPELQARLPGLIEHDAVPLLRLVAELSAARPDLLTEDAVQKLLDHPHPAVVDAAWQSAVRRQHPHSLLTLVAGIERPQDLLVAADRALLLGPWAEQAIRQLPNGRQRALLGLIVSGDVQEYLDQGRATAAAHDWPLYGQVAWAMADIDALRGWLQRGADHDELSNAQQVLVSALHNPLQASTPWAQLLAHRLRPDAPIPTGLAEGVASSDLSLWWGSLPYAARLLEEIGDEQSAGLARARANLLLAGWDQRIAEAQRQYREDRLPVLRTLRGLWAVEAVKEAVENGL